MSFESGVAGLWSHARPGATWAPETLIRVAFECSSLAIRPPTTSSLLPILPVTLCNRSYYVRMIICTLRPLFSLLLCRRLDEFEPAKFKAVDVIRVELEAGDPWALAHESH